MIIFRFFLSLLFVVAMSLPVFAQSSACWEMVAPPNGVEPEALVLLNKCEGKTWLMTRVFLIDKQGKRTGSWTFRWSPIATQENETILSLPKPN